MATTYYAPGVYIEEVDKGTKPIQGVATSVTAFIGFTQKAEKMQKDGVTTKSILGEPTLITNWGQYERHFGSYHSDAYLPYAVRGFFDNGGTRCYVTSVRSIEPHKSQALIEGWDIQKEKDIPVLLIRSATGGVDGNSVSVEIQPVVDEDETTLTARERLDKEFKAIISGVQPSPSDDQLALQDLDASIAKREETIKSLQAQADKIKKEWSDKGVNLEVTGKEWTQLKSAHPNANLDKVKADWMDLRKRVTDESTPLNSQKETQTTLKQKVSKEPSSDGPVEFTFSMKNLPFLSQEQAEARNWDAWRKEKNNPNAKTSQDTPKQGTLIDQKEQRLPVELWKLHKQGSQASVLPKTKEKTPLDFGTLQFDHKFLLEKGQLEETDLENPNQESLFIQKSNALYGGDETERRGIDGHFAIDDINLVCAPDLMKAYKIEEDEDKAETIVQSIQGAILTYCKKAHYPFAILDCPPDKTVQEISEWRMAMPGGDTMHGALYYPWVTISDPLDATKKIDVPPCGHIAGIYARSDQERGVHKAPANELVNGAIALERNVTHSEQELLNPMGVNCIRSFPGRGIRVWGARTLAMTDPAWRYINVRRLFSYVEASVERSTQWVVFEPNDHALWAKVRRDVTAFLRTVWLQGALFGKTPETAFYVKCDEETNLPELRDLGQMVCEIGMAPVKPAEFVVFRFSQWSADADA